MLFGLALAAAGAALIVWLVPPPMPTTKSDAKGPGEFQPASLDRPVPPFQLINQEGQTKTNEDLKGKIWVAGFIFTRCHDTCPMVTATMREVRKELPDDVMLVTFSVDPDHDTPEVLAKYAEGADANPANWWFLTGNREQIYRVSRDGFLLDVKENPDPKAEEGELITHSNRVVIVGPDGVARTTYNALDPASVQLLVRKVEQLREETQ